MKRHVPPLLAASLAFLVGVCSASNVPYQIGHIHAYIDVARGHYELKTYGPINGDLEEFSEIAAEEYGIEVVTHGCIISTEGIEHTRGYNDVSVAAIERKYGAGVIDSIRERAKALYRAR